jgi:hypothetical protein
MGIRSEAISGLDQNIHANLFIINRLLMYTGARNARHFTE